MLRLRAGDAADGNTVADVTLALWSQGAALLTPVIGERGVDALFQRALHVTSKSFPWLSVEADGGGSPALLGSIRLRLADCAPEAALEAGGALLVTFTELLANLIGESLTGRLLGPVWTPPSPEPEQERRHE